MFFSFSLIGFYLPSLLILKQVYVILKHLSISFC
nr:MAG TPA: hypothetical protein [Caudoviricetes sp.]